MLELSIYLGNKYFLKGIVMLNALTEAEIRLVSEYFDLSCGGEPPLAIWVIGRPAAGKTTVATLLYDILRRAGHRVEIIDGDLVRSVLNGSQGYSQNDRLSVFKKYVDINHLLQKRGIIPITATIGGFRQFRKIARKNLQNPRFIYLDCPMEVAAGRDQKGHYARALAGEIKDFFGVDIPYEVPDRCELRIDSAKMTPIEIVAGIVEHVNRVGLLRKIRHV